jgi:hypothetical protein
MVVDEESLSAVAFSGHVSSGAAAQQNSWFQKNDFRVNFSISFWNRIFSLARAHKKIWILFLML